MDLSERLVFQPFEERPFAVHSVGFRPAVEVEVFGGLVHQVILEFVYHAADGFDCICSNLFVFDVLEQFVEARDPEDFGVDGKLVEVQREAADEVVGQAGESSVEHASLGERGVR